MVHQISFQISCLDCSVETGKIAAAYDDRVVIFEPTPLRPIDPQQQGTFYTLDKTGFCTERSRLTNDPVLKKQLVKNRIIILKKMKPVCPKLSLQKPDQMAESKKT